MKPLAGEGAEVIVPTLGVVAAYTGYALPVIATGEKVFADLLYPLEAELPVCAGIYILISVAEIMKMLLEDRMQRVPAPWKVLGSLFSQCGSALYTHI